MEQRIQQVTGVGLQQQQTITPQMQQSLKVLQVSALELSQMVSAELLENPVLEAELEEPSVEELNLDTDGDDFEGGDEERLEEEWYDFIEQSGTNPVRNAEEESKRAFLFDSLTEKPTLQQHLMEQLQLADVTMEIRHMCEFLIGLIDDRGFLQADVEETALENGLRSEDLKQALDVLKGFDPSGVAARDFRECLLIQLERQGKAHSLEARVVSRCLEDLAMKRYERIAKALSVSLEEVAEAEKHIASLNPHPARQFESGINPYVEPDVIVTEKDGGFEVSLTGSYVPKLRISNDYKDMILRSGTDAEARKFIREKIRSGKLFMRSVHQRQETVERIAREIVSRQEEFFRLGPGNLKPMRMADIAGILGVHETTVSRAVSGKYMATPRGLFELRYFFTIGIASDSGENLSNTSVKAKLQEIIDEEPPDEPYSDQKLVALLEENGMPIARRTVAKYRKELNILPSSMRRRVSIAG